jgi:hypothetical protein
MGRHWLGIALAMAMVSCGVGGDDLAAVSEGLSTAAARATNDDTAVSYTVSYTGTHKYFRVYIDADQKPTTGLAVAGIRAEYLIENAYLYSYAGDGKSWVWTRIGSSGYGNTGTDASWRVPRAALGEVTACGEQADLLFDVDSDRTEKITHVYTPAASCAPPTAPPPTTPPPTTPPPTTPPPTTTPPPPPPPSSGIANPIVTTSGTSVTYQFSYAGTPKYLRVYIDADQSPASGLAVSGMGADYLIENSWLYGFRGPGWAWSQIGTVTASAANQLARWTVDRARVGQISACREANILFESREAGTGVRYLLGPVGQPCTAPPPPPPPATPPPGAAAANQYVFVIMMENVAASAVYDGASAPYFNDELVPRFARADAFFDPLADDAPSLPHYIFMEAGTNQFADVLFTTNDDPSATYSTASTAHLTTLMGNATPPVSWLSYQEGLDADTGLCPVRSAGFYGAKHNPYVYFRDVAGSPPSPTEPICVAHHRPFTTMGFAADLQARAVGRYNLITPDVCNDMHGDPACPNADRVRAGDDWLRQNLPTLIDFVMAESGVIFIVWDEPDGGTGPLIPFLAIGPHVKPGYAGQIPYTHASVTKTVSEIFGLPILPTVTGANDFADLFAPGFFP